MTTMMSPCSDWWAIMSPSHQANRHADWWRQQSFSADLPSLSFSFSSSLDLLPAKKSSAITFVLMDPASTDIPLELQQSQQPLEQQEEKEKEETDIPEADIVYHDKSDRHGQASWLSDVILGGQDGMVNALSVLMGVAAASNDKKVILAAGLAATFAESISMAAVAYTSMLADRDFYKSEREREYRHIQKVPNIEKREVRDLFIQKGFQVSSDSRKSPHKSGFAVVSLTFDTIIGRAAGAHCGDGDLQLGDLG